ncbi:hypothetical protein [Frankia sp. QA3]|uniref:hypothetical protein n=1 Tax=Frankia sp. QA3 TaxID=710111 RepID=UPI0002DB6ABB|nr:hypothetical protein [Frankia sp. QA3]
MDALPGGGPGAQSPSPGLDDADAVELAVSLSPAARIDSTLIRAVRSALHPTMPATVEAAFWFGPLVSRRGGGTVTLDREVLPTLRDRLMARPPGHPAHADAVRAVLRRVRDGENAGPYLRLEEELTWLGLLAAGPDAIDTLLARPLTDLRAGGALARDVAMWAALTLPRLPASAVTDSPAAWLLAQAAGGWVGGAAALAGGPPNADVARLLPILLPADLPRVEIGARLLGGSVELSWPPLPGAHLMRAPATGSAVVVELAGPGLVAAPEVANAVSGTSPPPGTTLGETPNPGGDPADNDRRVLIHRSRTVPRDVEAAAAEFLTDAGFDPVRGGFGSMAPDAWRETVLSCHAAVYLVEQGSSASRAEADILHRVAAQEAPAVVVEIDVRRGVATSPGLSSSARDGLLRSLAPVMSAQGPDRTVLVPHGRPVTVATTGAVWLRTLDGPWHVLCQQVPAGLPALGPAQRGWVGRFRLSRVIPGGRQHDGALGEDVFLGRAPGGPLAAVMVTPPSLTWAPGFGELLRRWASLDEPAVCRLLAAGQDAGSSYVATEFVEGSTLRERAARGDHLVGDELRRFAFDLARALAALHAAGLAHGHLRPDAVLFGPAGLRLARIHTATIITLPSRRRPGQPEPEFETDRRARTAGDIADWADLVALAANGQPASAATSANMTDRLGADLAALVIRAAAGDSAAGPTAAYLVAALDPARAAVAAPAPVTPWADPARLTPKRPSRGPRPGGPSDLRPKRVQEPSGRRPRLGTRRIPLFGRGRISGP